MPTFRGRMIPTHIASKGIVLAGVCRGLRRFEAERKPRREGPSIYFELTENEDELPNSIFKCNRIGSLCGPVTAGRRTPGTIQLMDSIVNEWPNDLR